MAFDDLSKGLAAVGNPGAPMSDDEQMDRAIRLLRLWQSVNETAELTDAARACGDIADLIDRLRSLSARDGVKRLMNGPSVMIAPERYDALVAAESSLAAEHGRADAAEMNHNDAEIRCLELVREKASAVRRAEAAESVSADLRARLGVARAALEKIADKDTFFGTMPQIARDALTQFDADTARRAIAGSATPTQTETKS